MHLRALNSADEVIFASQAVKQADYRCLECLALVRLREGILRQPHFYHLNSGVSCRQNGKSLTHLQLQIFIQKLLQEEAALEVPFSSIHRIADVVWEKERLVIEIQCSPISRSEVIERTHDYKSIGFEVVWILHERRFNKRRLSACEHALKTLPHYYSNMSSSGEGIIYDQWQRIDKGIRKKKLPPLPINIACPYRNFQTLGFKGDLNSLEEDHPYRTLIAEQELSIISSPFDWINHVKKICRLILQTLIKNYCKQSQ